MSIDISTRRGSDGVAVVRLAGELDLATAPTVERKLADVESEGPSTIVIDLRRLDFLDSTGLRVILAADGRARSGGWRLLVIPGAEPVQRVFRLTLLDRRLDFVDDPAVIDGTGASDA